MTDTKHSWVEIPEGSDFTMYNFPFGIAQYQEHAYVVSRLGDQIIILAHLNKTSCFEGLGLSDDVLISRSLNDFIALGKGITVPVRERMISYFGTASNDQSSECLVPANEVSMLLPVEIKDYTDFYSSRQHATNIGTMFRDPANALLPNWLHLPVGYHGRASSIVVSGTDIHRPKGQQKPADAPPVFGSSKLLDFELEMGFIVGKATELGDSVDVNKAEDYIFGLALFNDWSARDIQKWEYVPLGPFLGKNFASTLSPWIITLEALEPFRIPSPMQEPEVLDYLKSSNTNMHYDIELYVDIETPNGDVNTISTSNFQYMYWSMCQQLAHHTVNGCNINVGDLYASGTISGNEPGSYGSMLELSWRGTKPLKMKDGTERKFIQDEDTLCLRGKCEKGNIRLGFGDCKGKLLPAK